MADWILYFCFANMAVVLVLGIRSQRMCCKLTRYLQARYPNKAKEFGWYGLKFANSLYRQWDIDDPEFDRLRGVAKNSCTVAIVALLPFVVLVVIVTVMRVVFA